MRSVASPPRLAVVLAAGKGTRMVSETPKALHRACGRPLLAWVLDAARAAGCERLLVVVGHGAEQVRAAFASAPDVTWIEQDRQLGTGHALAQAAGEVAGEARLLVLSGDVPLITARSLQRLDAAAERGWGAMAVATFDRPGALGRVIGDGHGHLRRIVEARDALPDELELHTINAGIYLLPAPDIFERLSALTPENAQGELYLTDAVTAAAAAGERVALVELEDREEASGVNDRLELAYVHGRLTGRKIATLARDGTTFLAPDRVTLDAGVEVGVDSVVHADVTLLGATTVGAGATLHAGAWLRDCEVGDGAVIEPYSVLDGAVIGRGCRVGPFARLRPGAVLEDEARVGNFVEVKNARLGLGAKANHLAYLGDAEVGAGANIGAGVVTCNYDGVAKHRTEIGERAFIGSDTMLVAPLKIGSDATTGAGSVITRDVPDGALAVERAAQRTVAGWSSRRAARRKPTTVAEGD